MNKRKYFIFGSLHRKENQEEVVNLLTHLSKDQRIELSFEWYFMQELLQIAPAFESPQSATFETIGSECDAVICFGGDGTTLQTVHRLPNLQMPILAINVGRLGFLTDLNPMELFPVVDQLINKEYAIDSRTLIDVYAGDELLGCALNEVSVERCDTGSMINVRVELEEQLLANYAADGVILSTPTGSTAYSLSVGGPIVAPECQTIVISPIAPHSLNMRPLVIPDNRHIRLTVSSHNGHFAVAMDGTAKSYPCETPINIVQSKHKAQFIRLKNESFTSILRDKLMWGKNLR